MKKLNWRQEKVGRILTDAYYALMELKESAPNHLDENCVRTQTARLRKQLRSLRIDPVRGEWFEEDAEALTLSLGEGDVLTGDGEGEHLTEVEGEEGDDLIGAVTGLEEEKYNGRLSKEHTASIIAAYREGLTVAQISDKTNIEESKVSAYISKQSKSKLLGND